ncbi:MAG: hypothetical protein ACPG4F_04530 [Paracoccaceae bacterium]
MATKKKLLQAAAGAESDKIPKVAYFYDHEDSQIEDTSSIACDTATGDIYVGANNHLANGFEIYKLNSELELQWVKSINNYAVSNTNYINAGRVNRLEWSSYNDLLYFNVGLINSSSNYAYVGAIDSDGVAQYSRAIKGSGTETPRGGLAINPSNGYVYIGSDLSYPYISRFTSQLTSSFLDKEISSNTSPVIRSLHWGRDGYLYVVLDGTTTGSQGSDVYISKYNSSLSWQWSKRVHMMGSLDSSTQSDNAVPSSSNVGVDSSGNIYLSAIGGGDSIFLIKYNSGATQQWIRTFRHTNGETNASLDHFAHLTDEDGTSYVLSRVYENDYNPTSYLQAIDTSGDTVWERIINCQSDQGATVSNSAMQFDEDGNILIVLPANPSSFAVMRVPTDGSGLGVYNVLSYNDTNDANLGLVNSDSEYLYETTASTSASQMGSTNTTKSSITPTMNISNKTTSTRVSPAIALGDFEVVGLFSHDYAGSTANNTIELGTNIQENDVIILASCSAGTGATISDSTMVDSGWTSVDNISQQDTNSITLNVFRKTASASESNTATLSGSGYTANAQVVMGLILRGVASGVPFGGSIANGQSGNTLISNPTSYTPTQSNTLIVYITAAAHKSSQNLSLDNDDFDFFVCRSSNDTYDATMGIGLKKWDSGAFDAGANTTNYSSSANDSSVYVMFALKT